MHALCLTTLSNRSAIVVLKKTNDFNLNSPSVRFIEANLTNDYYDPTIFLFRVIQSNDLSEFEITKFKGYSEYSVGTILAI